MSFSGCTEVRKDSRPSSSRDGGTWVTSNIAGTDPHQGYTNFFHGRDTLFFEAPGLPVSVAQNHNRQIYNPLTLTESLFKG